MTYKQCPLHPRSPSSTKHGCITCLRLQPQYRQIVPNADRIFYKRAKEVGAWKNTAEWIKHQWEYPDQFIPFVIKGGKNQ